MTPPEEPSTLLRAYHLIEQLQQRVDAADRTRSEPVAVVGIGCRLPGGAVDPASYWAMLSTGTDAIGEVPPDRFDVDRYFHPTVGRPGTMTTRSGGFLKRVDEFDPAFFGISRREAVAMDPQQRLVLEVAWEALENAGLPPDRLSGRRGGVFIGACANDYATTRFTDARDVNAYASTGTAHSVISGRLSYLLDLRGPSVTVDTACSSSLVAVHLAAQSLRAGESDIALAGGVNVILSPMPTIAFSQFGMMAADGRCKTFDAAADGFVRGEGCGIVVLKRLSDAVQDGDDVLAVLRASAVNQDGRSSGLTAPNVLAQRDLLREALDRGGLHPDEVSYVEAHGTGTPLGDPIEVEALSEVYRRDGGEPCYLGSVKTNIGHLEAAAGIAGLIKVVLALRHEAIPPHLHFERLSPHLDLSGTPFVVPTQLHAWPVGPRRRIGTVSSFGFSGTNAHVIIEEAPRNAAATTDVASDRPEHVLALSARTPTALATLASRYRDLLDRPDAAAADVCHSANTGRSHFPYRMAVVGRDRADLRDQLGSATTIVEPRPGAGDPGVVMLFTGQGAQYPGMAQDLYRSLPTFRQTLDECASIVDPLLDRPLLSVLHPGDPDACWLDQTAYTQPALFAVEYALAQLWRSWGVEPAAVLGHSLGEYVAACVAGVLPVADALRLVAQRARLMQDLPAGGAMAAVFASEEEVARVVAGHRADASVAAVNGPDASVISGRAEVVRAICATFAGAGVRTEALRVSHAFHSPLIEPMLAPLHRAADGIDASPPRVPLVSNVTGELWPWDGAPDADYWCRHARMPVRFAAGVQTLHRLGHRTFLEVGPSPTLLGLVRPVVGQERTVLLPSLRRGRSDWSILSAAVAGLYEAGVDIDWSGYDRDFDRRRVTVPTYPFERVRCWFESAYAAGNGGPQPGPANEEADEPDTAPDEDLLYRVEWVPAPTTPAGGPVPPAWLVLADSAPVGDQIVARLATLGATAVRAGHPDDLASALAEAARSTPLEVVYVSGQPESTVEDASAATRYCATAAAAVSALMSTGAAGRLWLVTTGADGPAGALVPSSGPAQASLWGLGRSLSREHPELWGGLIDLDPADSPAQAAAQLVDAVVGSDGEDQVAFRGGVRHVPRLRRTTVDAGRPRWRPDATYLITGGLGDLGLAVARSMARDGARRLVLLGRTVLPPRDAWTALPPDDPTARRIAAVREVESLGAAVHPVAVDVGDETAMREFLSTFDREGWPPIRGIVHAAGLVAAGAVPDLGAAELDQHLRPKAVGAWVLHRLFADRPLDFFVLFSSASAVLSSPFIAAYAAANAYLNGLARYRRTLGLPALAIEWGYWSRIGIAARLGQDTPQSGHGMGALPPRQALRVLDRLMWTDTTEVAVLPVDWDRRGRSHTGAAASPYLADLATPATSTAGAGTPARAERFSRADLLALTPDRRLPMLTGRLLAGVAAALATPATTLRVDQPLFELGLDSLMAMELKNQVETTYEVSIPLATFLEGASIRRLAEEILARTGADPDPAAVTGAIPRQSRVDDATADLLDELDELTEEQARTLLERQP
jgi:acyl transferase domain-containing protein